MNCQASLFKCCLPSRNKLSGTIPLDILNIASLDPRRTPSGCSASGVTWNVNTDDLPDEWYCKDNFWDAADRATCETGQDQFNADKESTVFNVEEGAAAAHAGGGRDTDPAGTVPLHAP
jgi:hypothetical protein